MLSPVTYICIYIYCFSSYNCYAQQNHLLFKDELKYILAFNPSITPEGMILFFLMCFIKLTYHTVL